MNSARLLLLSCLLAALASVPSNGQEFLLYTPKPSAGEQAPTSPAEGVLVKRVTVKRGDTLAKLSKRYLGGASRFQRVLVFNSIKNPDLIYPGDELLVPVPAGHKVFGKAAAKGEKRPVARRSPPRGKPVAERRVRSSDAFGEQESYQRAWRAYLDGDYQTASELFARFVRSYPHSRLAADAALYRADSLLQLSGE